MDNSLIVFDLDGVLVDSKEIHFNALNLALAGIDPSYVITLEEQRATYEGMTTRTKLRTLLDIKGLPEQCHKDVWNKKQEYTASMFSSIGYDREMVSHIGFIKSFGIKVAVASNSIRTTLDAALTSMGIQDLVDLSLSNEDVLNPKPSPEIYNMCMNQLNTLPNKTVVLEDSKIGVIAAKASGARVEVVKNRGQIDLPFIMRVVGLLDD